MEYPKDVTDDFETLKGGGLLDGVGVSLMLINSGLRTMGLRSGILWAKDNPKEVVVLWHLTKV